MDFERLHHRFRAEFWISFAGGILDRVDRRTGEEQNILRHAALFHIGKVDADIALIQSARAPRIAVDKGA